MMTYRKKGSRVWWLTLTTREKTYIRLPSGTHDKPTAEGMQEMLSRLSRRGSRSWDIVEAIEQKRISVPEVHDYYIRDDLESLRARLEDVDLASDIDGWEKSIERELAKETVRKYKSQVAVLFPRGADAKGKPGKCARLPALRSVVLEKGYLKRKLAEVGGGNTNRARHGAAWASVFRHLTELGHFDRNPMDSVTIPSSDEGDTPHIDELRDVLELVNAMPEGTHRAMAAVREGSGMETQAAVAMRLRDVVDRENRIVWAHGEKNKYRDRQVIVDEWAWTIFINYVDSLHALPGALLFPVTEDQHRDEHNAACAALRERGVAIPEEYTPHACRHTFTIRGLREGREEILLANNLGHADTSTLRRVYGKFRLKITDIIRADRRAKEASK